MRKQLRVRRYSSIPRHYASSKPQTSRVLQKPMLNSVNRDQQDSVKSQRYTRRTLETPELLSNIFQFDNNIVHNFSQYYRQHNSQKKLFKDIKATSNVLFWPCGHMQFLHSDFQSLLPPSAAQLHPMKPYSFHTMRNRDPNTLVPYIGYFLVFPNNETAEHFYRETLQCELNGIEIKFEFVPADRLPMSQDENSSLKSAVIIHDVPKHTQREVIAQISWDFMVHSNEHHAFQKLPSLEGEFGERWIVRFATSSEARLFKLKFHNAIWPLSNNRITVEMLD